MTRALFLPGGTPGTLTLFGEFLDFLIAYPNSDAQELHRAQQLLAQLHNHRYLFWQGSPPDLALEIAHLPSGHWDLVVAKSLGTLMFLKGLHSQQFTFGRALLMGLPSTNGQPLGIEPELYTTLNQENILVMQQEQDSLCPADVLNAIQELTINLHTIPGSDHLYQDFTHWLPAWKNFVSL